MSDQRVPFRNERSPRFPMTPDPHQSAPEIALSRITGIVIFLVFAGLLNLVTTPSSGLVLTLATAFVNANIGLILAMAVVFLIGDLSRALQFPFNLPGPLFHAAGSVLLLGFLARILMLVDRINGITIFSVFERLIPLLSPLVFFVVLTAGILEIMTGGKRR